MHQNRSHKKVGMLKIIGSCLIVGICKVTTFISDCFYFTKRFCKAMWNGCKNIFAYMEWGNIWNGIKLLLMMPIMCCKLAYEETMLMKEQRQREIEDNLFLGAPVGFFQQAKYNLVMANF